MDVLMAPAPVQHSHAGHFPAPYRDSRSSVNSVPQREYAYAAKDYRVCGNALTETAKQEEAVVPFVAVKKNGDYGCGR